MGRVRVEVTYAMLDEVVTQFRSWVHGIEVTPRQGIYDVVFDVPEMGEGRAILSIEDETTPEGEPVRRVEFLPDEGEAAVYRVGGVAGPKLRRVVP